MWRIHSRYVGFTPTVKDSACVGACRHHLQSQNETRESPEVYLLKT